jgi:hypothetical protein
MQNKSIEFKAPEGMEMPDGIAVGDTLEVMAKVALGEEGELYLLEIDGLTVAGTKEEEAEEKTPVEKEIPEEEGGFLEAVERRASRS